MDDPELCVAAKEDSACFSHPLLPQLDTTGAPDQSNGMQLVQTVNWAIAMRIPACSCQPFGTLNSHTAMKLFSTEHDIVNTHQTRALHSMTAPGQTPSAEPPTNLSCNGNPSHCITNGYLKSRCYPQPIQPNICMQTANPMQTQQHNMLTTRSLLVVAADMDMDKR